MTFRAAEAVRCAGDQGKAEEMRNILYQNQGRWLRSPDPEADWRNYARGAKHDLSKWGSCLRRRAHRAEIEADRKLGIRLGVNATPTIFIGGRKIVGAVPFERMAAELRAELTRR